MTRPLKYYITDWDTSLFCLRGPQLQVEYEGNSVTVGNGINTASPRNLEIVNGSRKEVTKRLVFAKAQNNSAEDQSPQKEETWTRTWYLKNWWVNYGAIGWWRKICSHGTPRVGILQTNRQVSPKKTSLSRGRIVWNSSHFALRILQTRDEIFVQYGRPIRKVWAHVGWESTVCFVH